MIKIAEIVCGLQNGGVESFLYNYISRFEKGKFQIDIITHGKSNEKTKRKFLELGCNVVEIVPKRKSIIKNIMQLYKVLKENEYDIIHCHMSKNNVIPLKIGKILKINIRISHSHQASINENYFKKFLRSLSKFGIRRNSTLNIACGKNAGKSLYYDEFIVLHNAIDLKKFEYNEESRRKIREELNIKDNEILIGNVGRLAYPKNHKFMIDLMKKISDSRYKLLLIGDGELKDEIINQIKINKLQTKIIMLNNKDNINEYMDAMDIFILPSLFEGLPLVSIEAQASGVKCIFSDNIDNEILMSENSKMLPLNLEQWKDEIVNYKNICRLNNLETIRKKGYDIEIEKSKLEKIYMSKSLEK